MSSFRLALPILTAMALIGCGGDSGSSSSNDSPGSGNPGQTDGKDLPDDTSTVCPLKVAVLPDTQGGGNNASILPMRALLELYREQDADVVLVVGDLSENATPAEYQQWLSVANDFREDFVFLPLQGNHDIKGADQDWYDSMRDFVPADAIHMPGQEYKTYAWMKENVLLITVSYGHMPYAYDFIREMIDTHRDQADHIIVSTHNSMVGSRYGYIREKAVEAWDTSASDQAFLQVHEDYRDLFAENHVIYVAGHEHQYGRSLVNGTFGGHFTEIVAGHASYKGYDSRYGESELIQNVVMTKMNDWGDDGLIDVNASLFTFDGTRVDYASWFDSHSIHSNEDGLKELATVNWKLLDRFSRTNDACEKIVFPASIPASNQLNMLHDKRYRTNPCLSPEGTSARILDGENTIFNRYDTRTRTTNAEPGLSTAQDNYALAARYFRWLYIDHASYNPNLNNSQRIRMINQGTEDEELEIRETTIDLKKHVTLSWVDGWGTAQSEALIVSGIQGQDGTYLDARGNPKDIATATGLPGSLGDGSEDGKQPVALPVERVNSNHNLADDTAGDDYVLQFSVPENTTAENLTLARWDETQERWTPVVASECISSMGYQSAYLSSLPADVDAGCATAVGVDTLAEPHFWARLHEEGTFALIER